MHPGSVLTRRLWTTILLLFLGLAISLALQPVSTSAHAELDHSQPSPGASLGSGPSKLQIWFTEGLTPSGSSAKVYDAQRHEVDKGDYTVDPNDPKHLTVSLEPLPNGTYTVAWTSISSDDGHVIHGTYTFTVGVSRLPGAAASSNGHPTAGAVALRWLVFLGLMVPAGWFLLSLLGIGLSVTRWWVVLGGALLALLADLLLLPVTAYWPGPGLPTQSLANTYSIMPQAWLARVILESVILLLAIAVLVSHRKGIGITLIGLLLSGAAIFELALTTHAAARTSDKLAAIVSEVVHLESVAFWIGGLTLLALLPRAVRAGFPQPIRRFSRLAFLLAPLAVASGILNAGITLPSLDSLTQSSYGKILLIKIVFVVGILVLAWLNRRAVHAGVTHALSFVRALRIELAFGATAILLASILSLWTPPQPAKIIPLRLSQTTSDKQVAHVVVDPVHDGPNTIDAWLTDAKNAPVAEVSNVVVHFTMLERNIDLPDQQMQAGANGHFTVKNVPLTVQGWWGMKLIFLQGSGASTTAQFFFMVPDPLLAGGLHHRKSDQQAQDLFNAAIDQIETLNSMRALQTLSDGVGNNVDTVNEYEAPNKFAYQTSSDSSSVAIGETQWFRQGDEPWTKNQRVDEFQFPHTLTTYYDGATEFTLGRSETIDGEECQIITFSVPAAPQQGVAWYAWWVGKQTHLLRREAMVADHHYMINHNVDFNSSEIAIAPPTTSTP
jgi:copper transport protein